MLLGGSFPPPFICLKIQVAPSQTLVVTTVSSGGEIVSKCSIHRSLVFCYLFLPAWLGGMQENPSKG